MPPGLLRQGFRCDAPSMQSPAGLAQFTLRGRPLQSPGLTTVSAIPRTSSATTLSLTPSAYNHINGRAATTPTTHTFSYGRGATQQYPTELHWQAQRNGHEGAPSDAQSGQAAEGTQQQVGVRVVVPYHVTSFGSPFGECYKNGAGDDDPCAGERVVLCGSVPELGNWDPTKALSLKWGPGHCHSAVTTLPTDVAIFAKVYILRDGGMSWVEAGADRNITLLPESFVSWIGNGSSSSSGEAEVQHVVLCHLHSTACTQVVPRPVLGSSSNGLVNSNSSNNGFGSSSGSSDQQTVPVRFTVLPAGPMAGSLPAGQYPVIVGSVEQLGAWNVKKGLRLQPDVNGMWSIDAELPLATKMEAKLAICNAEGNAVAWEGEGGPTANRHISTHLGEDAKGGMVLLISCTWGILHSTPAIQVPAYVQPESSKQFDPTAELYSSDYTDGAATATSRSLARERPRAESLEKELAETRAAEKAALKEAAVLRQQLIIAQREAVAAKAEAGSLLPTLKAAAMNYVAAANEEIQNLRLKVQQLEEQLGKGSGQGRPLSSKQGKGRAPWGTGF